MRYLKSQLKIMPIVSCFKRITYQFLFIVVEITFHHWPKMHNWQTNEPPAWGSYCGEMTFKV